MIKRNQKKQKKRWKIKSKIQNKKIKILKQNLILLKNSKTKGSKIWKIK